LQRTGVFLTLLPILTFWVVPLARAQQEQLADPDPYGKYAALWFLIGALYATVGCIRQSSRFALLAGLTVNAGLWALLYWHQVSFLVHPQLWLIQLAVILLVD